jgi:hypothetical protein
MTRILKKLGVTMKLILSLLFITLLFSSLHSQEVALLAEELKLYGGLKATIQWERIFSSHRRMEKYHLNSLSNAQRRALKAYLIKYAADSEQPMVPGL